MGYAAGAAAPGLVVAVTASSTPPVTGAPVADAPLHGDSSFCESHNAQANSQSLFEFMFEFQLSV